MCLRFSLAAELSNTQDNHTGQCLELVGVCETIMWREWTHADESDTVWSYRHCIDLS